MKSVATSMLKCSLFYLQAYKMDSTSDFWKTVGLEVHQNFRAPF